MRSSLVRLEGVTCRYRSEPVIREVNLTVGSDELTAIVGPSGSGKTTLLRALLGALPPAAGRVVRSAGVQIGYVPQVETVDWGFPVTVEETLMMARPADPWWSGLRITKAERARASALLERLGLGGLGGRHIRELSGGQQQRVFIARALMAQPDLVVMDEPTAGVDVRTRHDILHLLGQLHDDGLSILLTTHDLNGLAAHLPRIVCLHGRVVADGSPAEVLTPDVLEQTYGAPMEVLRHGGMPVVVDSFPSRSRVSGVPTGDWERAGHRHQSPRAAGQPGS